MNTRKSRSRASRLAPVLQSASIGAITYVLLVVLLLLGIAPEQHDIQIGLPAGMDIMATKDVNDVVTTERNREAAAAAVEPSFKSVDASVLGDVMRDLEAKIGELNAIRTSLTPEGASELTDEAIEELNGQLGIALTREQYATLAGADASQLETLFGDVSGQVRGLLSNTLLEGQEAAGIATLSRALTSSGYDQPLVSLASELMKSCVRPNMLIDEEATEAKRQQARDAVETVTCVKGEVVVRRGDIVTDAQYQMLASLGLLKEESLDIPLFAGIALIVLLILAALTLYLYRYKREFLKPRMLSLLGLIFVLVTMLSLAISRWNTYLMPVALGMMLVALLLDHRAALYCNIALGMMVSMLADASSGVFSVAMFSIVGMSMVSGPLILFVFSRSMQRTTTLFTGVLVGVSNFLTTMAVGLINSAELSAVMTNAVWAMAGGLLSAVLCIGFQPLMEWMFNLATNAKLIELSNPNQALLRRLLLEAPGTYHHSIIVANLAEAAATAVGGNGLLARVGAYYHDVGKLKRPTYFKENQLGDNPHDRTDPRVSAAILTAHPRDGAAMAQKARIPEPVIDIIRQHHGDGVALWFYDKAVKLYGADQVDISAFRYDGPRPRSREAAVVMLADSIEAAVRSIPDPDPEKVDALIRKLVRAKLDDGQLDDSDLTFSDLEKICSAFSTVLTGVFHERIEYPDVNIPPRNEKPEEPAAQPHAPVPTPAPAQPMAQPASKPQAAPVQPTVQPAAKPQAVPVQPAAPAPAQTEPPAAEPASPEPVSPGAAPSAAPEPVEPQIKEVSGDAR